MKEVYSQKDVKEAFRKSQFSAMGRNGSNLFVHNKKTDNWDTIKTQYDIYMMDVVYQHVERFKNLEDCMFHHSKV